MASDTEEYEISDDITAEGLLALDELERSHFHPELNDSSHSAATLNQVEGGDSVSDPKVREEQIPALPPGDAKRGRGRPPKRCIGLDAETSKPKRPVGRPPGTGNKQKPITQLRRPVGRPRKTQRPVDPSERRHFISGLHVPGSQPPTQGNGSSVWGLFSSSSNATQGADSGSQSTSAHTVQSLSVNDIPSGSGSLQMPNPPLASSFEPALQPPALPAVTPQPAPPRSIPADGVTFLDEEDNTLEDPDDNLIEDGLGQDDNADDDDDDADGSEHGQHSGSNHPHITHPTWLTEFFNHCVQTSRKRDTHGLPSLYRSSTFWFSKPAAFFALQKADVSPDDLYDCDMFLWDPLALVPGITCPNAGCTSRLWRHTHVRNPRRVVDFDRTFWIIGYRYRCPTCSSPKQVTFRSWDSRILAALPRTLAAEFPARLSYRSGISNRVFTFMRACFQSGMGAKKFSNALRIQHLEKHDELHLRYLHAIVASPAPLFNTRSTRPSFPSYDDRSSHGPHGFVPSSQWLRDMYDDFVEEHEHDYNQHTAMLSARICAIDHSFKLAKHIIKVDGVQVFTALLTVTNERGEIRVCSLVATKSHSQFELALQRMHDSLLIYGLEQPVLFYTDNIADKDFLERCFPSLRKDLVPVEKYSDLDALTIPADFTVSVKSGVTAIDDAMRTILELLPDDDEGKLVIALDAEWNVDVGNQGNVVGRGQTAILTIGIHQMIFVLQIGSLLSQGKLPDVLKQVLSNPRILKVGRCVSADLKYLQQSSHSTAPFVGAVDLARLAKERLLVTNARVSLSDLSAVILKRRLNKNVSERVSMAWENDTLTVDQIQYAALDVYASLAMYTTMLTISVPTRLRVDGNLDTGMEVLLFNSDGTRILAEGTISPHAHDNTYTHINITPSRTVIEITRVHVPGALISNGTSTKTKLDTLGPPPFHIVCLRNHLRTSNGRIFQPPSVLPSFSSGTESEPAPIGQALGSNESDDNLSPSDSDDSTARLGEMILDSIQGDAPALASTSAALSEPPAPSLSHSINHDSQTHGEQVLAEARDARLQWPTEIRSRVLKDPFHVFNMIYISASHGLLRDFAIALRDAIFIPDATDKARIVAWGAAQNPPLSWDLLLFRRPKWLLRHCKRIIPPPEELYDKIESVFRTYGPLQDNKTKHPLFNTAAWAVAKNILQLVQKGFLSDPPGIALYYQLGVSAKTGLPIYRCMRGTNMTEGGVHTHLRSRLPTSGVSIRHIQSCLLDFILRHNLLVSPRLSLSFPTVVDQRPSAEITSFKVGIFNSTGQRYTGHYSIWLINELQEMQCLLQDKLDFRTMPVELVGWVNGNLYQPTKEVSGVLPITNDLRAKAGMGVFVADLHSKQPHAFLASRQGTRKPILPIHNGAEHDLFRELIATASSHSNTNAEPNWDTFTTLWNSKADTMVSISYKVRWSALVSLRSQFVDL